MKSLTVGAATLLAALPYASALGSAIVINNCASQVWMWNTPSAGGGGVEVDKVISPGGSYSQVYQALTNGNGWSLKIAPTDSQAEVMQFEYTYQNDGTLWYDMSYVNGDPMNGNWVMSSDSSACVPKQTYYRYSTDDANGMQDGCSSDVSITLTLCPGGGGDSGTSSAAPASSAPPATSEPVPSSAAAPPPAPVVTHKPKPPQPPKIFTTFITQVVTVDYTAVAKREPEPTGEAKRDVHMHEHHHRHAHAHAHGRA